MDKKGERRLSGNATFYYLFNYSSEKVVFYVYHEAWSSIYSIKKHQNQTTARTDEDDRANAWRVEQVVGDDNRLSHGDG